MKLLIIGMLAAALYFNIRFTNKVIKGYGKKRDVGIYRVKYISRVISIGIYIFYAILVTNILGIEYSQISFFLSSAFAVIGVALFAQWSILSNITASLVIFFAFPYRVGDNIKILDKDDDISGVIEEISLFHVLIRQQEELITYPNSLMLQKGVIKRPQTNEPTNEPMSKVDTLK